MSQRQSSQTVLDGFRGRLKGGVTPAFRQGRPGGYNKLVDAEVIRNWEPDAFEQMTELRDETWDAAKAHAVISALAGQFRDDRRLLTAVLLAPDRILGWRIDEYEQTGKQLLLIDCWTQLLYIAEAAWLVTTTADLPADGGYGAGDAEFLRPAAARLRFLVLSEPMRWRGEDAATWIEPGDKYAGRRALRLVLGQETWHLLVARCREARTGWREILDAYQSYPLLSQAMPGELEQELRTLVLRGTRRLSAPLGLSVESLGNPAPLTAEDKTLIGDAIERHFLPRFELGTVTRLAMFDHRPSWQTARWVTGALVAAAALATLGYAIALRDHFAIITGVACYLLICLGMLVFPAEWGTVWLLRMPAAAAVGMVALVGFLPAGWLRTPPGGWLAVVALVGVSFGYLLIEARNHGVSSGAAAGRALVVGVVGAMHALIVSLIGLVIVAPAFVAGGQSLRGLWAHPGYGRAGMALALAAAWCLAVGVFSQILWDDRPITAPLAHLSWRR